MTTNYQPDENVLVWDLETQTFGTPDSNKDILKFFGCYSFKTNKYYLLTNKEDIQRVINGHKFLVGFNTENYDEPILKRFGVDIQYKIRIDLFNIFKERAGAIKIKEGILNDLLMSYSLDYITKTLHLVDEETSKLKFDYSILNKNSWTEEELKLIRDYTIRDLEITKKLYEWTENYFWSFRDFLTEEDVIKKRYLTVSIAKLTYKAICKALNWTEEYAKFGEDNGEEKENILGGYVAYPAGEEYHKGDNYDLYLFDFASLYPHVIMQANLFGRKKEGVLDNRPTWSGGGVWHTHGVYYTDEMSGVCKLIKQWYADRSVYKKAKDPKEYSVKIYMNTVSGIMETDYYIRVCDKVARKDCTGLGRQWARYVRKAFRKAGYQMIYTDTDSFFILDPFKDKDKLFAIKKEIVEYIKSTVPFPQDTFDVALEAEIKHLFFFKGGTEKSDDDTEMDDDDFINKPKGFMKKNYVYVTTDGKVVIKNLGVRKKSNTPLSRKIFWDYLVPQIKEGKIKFSKTFLKQLINDLLKNDLTLMALRKDVGPVSEYSKSPNGLQAQISQRYGPGIHFLIPNIKSIGVGKGKSYCTIEEFKTHNLRLEDIDLENVWKELEYFTKQAVNMNIFSFEGATKKDEEQIKDFFKEEPKKTNKWW